MRAAQSFVVYRGPSMLNGVPIVAILTGLGKPSKNDKTGAMLQLWIMPADERPNEAIKSGADAAVCGDCPMRPIHYRERGMSKPCYVKTHQAPLSTWKANRGARVELLAACHAIRASGRALRLGAYGDPAALPEWIVRLLAAAALSRTGYCHQWRDPRFQWLREFVMASADSEADREAAHALGWRTFRVYPRKSLPVLSRSEILCPSEIVECARCRLCDGSRAEDRRKSIAIEAH